MVVVRKNDGEMRLCVDVIRLNSVTQTDAYPMPHIDKLLDRIGLHCKKSHRISCYLPCVITRVFDCCKLSDNSRWYKSEIMNAYNRTVV